MPDITNQLFGVGFFLPVPRRQGRQLCAFHASRKEHLLFQRRRQPQRAMSANTPQPRYSRVSVTWRIAMHEADLTGHAQLHRTALGLRGEQGAHVDARADVHSISPEPLPKSSTRAPADRRKAAPSVAYGSGVNGL